MRKRMLKPDQPEDSTPDLNWLNLEELVEVEISSEDAAHPIEFALLPGSASGWRAADAGKQTIRLIFAHPFRLHHIRLIFEEREMERTQQYLLRWSPDGGESFQEIVRQQWNFSPRGATQETVDHSLEIEPVTVLELTIIPDISGGEAVASLAQLRLA